MAKTLPPTKLRAPDSALTTPIGQLDQMAAAKKESSPPPQAAPAPATPVRPQAAPDTERTMRTTVILPESVHQRLKVLAATEKRDMRDLILEGLESVFEAYGMGTK